MKTGIKKLQKFQGIPPADGVLFTIFYLLFSLADLTLGVSYSDSKCEGPGWSTQESFIQGGSVQRTKLKAIYKPLLTGKATLSYTFHRKWYPFQIPTVETLSFHFVESVRDI